MAISQMIQISIVYAPKARLVHEVNLSMPLGSTVSQALQVSDLWAQLSKREAVHASVGIWGRKVAPAHVLRDKDRVEIYRELTVDPKMARRERFVKQGSKGTGLFAKKRPGAAAGY